MLKLLNQNHGKNKLFISLSSVTMKYIEKRKCMVNIVTDIIFYNQKNKILVFILKCRHFY